MRLERPVNTRLQLIPRVTIARLKDPPTKVPKQYSASKSPSRQSGADCNRTTFGLRQVEPWLDERSPALLVDVQPVGCGGGFAVDQHAERDGRARPRAHDEMDVARMEAEGDSAAGFVQHTRPLL